MSLIPQGDPMPSIWVVVTEVTVYVTSSVIFFLNDFLIILDNHAAGFGVLIAFATFITNRKWSGKKRQ